MIIEEARFDSCKDRVFLYSDIWVFFSPYIPCEGMGCLWWGQVVVEVVVPRHFIPDHGFFYNMQVDGSIKLVRF